MIDLSEAFGMIGQDGCVDVASSLGVQGCDPEISIPIYEIFFLKLLGGQKTQFLANSMGEFNAIRHMAQSCGAVAATINVLDMDILTLIGVLMIATPNTGMNVFIKLGDIITSELPAEIIEQVASTAGIPIPDGALSSGIGLAQEVMQQVFDRLVDSIRDDLASNGINLQDWDYLPQYFTEIKESGEMAQMHHYRQQFGGMIL